MTSQGLSTQGKTAPSRGAREQCGLNELLLAVTELAETVKETDARQNTLWVSFREEWKKWKNAVDELRKRFAASAVEPSPQVSEPVSIADAYLREFEAIYCKALGRDLSNLPGASEFSACANLVSAVLSWVSTVASSQAEMESTCRILQSPTGTKPADRERLESLKKQIRICQEYRHKIRDEFLVANGLWAEHEIAGIVPEDPFLKDMHAGVQKRMGWARWPSRRSKDAEDTDTAKSLDDVFRLEYEERNARMEKWKEMIKENTRTSWESLRGLFWTHVARPVLSGGDKDFFGKDLRGEFDAQFRLLVLDEKTVDLHYGPEFYQAEERQFPKKEEIGKAWHVLSPGYRLQVQRMEPKDTVLVKGILARRTNTETQQHSNPSPKPRP